MRDKKPWYEKVGIWIGIISSIVTIIVGIPTIVKIINENNPNPNDSNNLTSAELDDKTVTLGEEVELLDSQEHDIEEDSFAAEENTIIPEENSNPDMYLLTFNTDTIRISPYTTAAKMIIQGMDDQDIVTNLNNKDFANIKIIDYSTDQIIDMRDVLLGESAVFSNVPNGTYYYTVECTGYKTYSSSLIQLIQNSSEEDDINWFVGLEQDDNVISQPFRIQLQSTQGVLPKNTTVYLRAISLKNNNSNMFSSQILYTNEDSYLTFWHRHDNNDYYDLIDFQLYDGYTLEASLDNKEFFHVDIQEDVSTCIIP